MRILLVDDHRLVADAFAMMLKELSDGVEVTVCHTTHRALSLIDEDEQFDLILTDLLMPGVDGLGLLHGLRSRKINTPTVVISSVDKSDDIQKALEHGVVGFIHKTMPKREMLQALRQVLAGQSYFPASLMPRKNSANSHAASHEELTTHDAPILSDRQSEVLTLMAAGNSNKQIAQLIGTSEANVKYHTSQLFKLLGVKNRTSCIREGYRYNLITNPA